MNLILVRISGHFC